MSFHKQTFHQDTFHQNKYPKSSINKLFDKWLKEQYDYKSQGEKEDAIVEVAISLGVETPLSKDEKIQVLKDNDVIDC